MHLLLHLKPDSTLMITAVLGLFCGTLLWLIGFRIARPALTMLLSAGGAFWGYLAPFIWHIPLVSIASAIVGALIGAILGSIGFRFMQAVLLAALLAVVVVSVCTWNHQAASKGVSPATAPVTAQSAVHHGNGVNARIWQVWYNARAKGQEWWKEVNTMPVAKRSQALAIAIGAGLVVLLLGLLFPRMTSIVATACLGSVALLLSLVVLGQAFDPSAVQWCLHQVRPRWLVVGGAVSGMILQGGQAIYQRRNRAKEKAKKGEAEKK